MTRITGSSRNRGKPTMKCSVAFVLVSVLVPAIAFAAATPYPSKPIRLIAPFAPGGGVDVSARFIAQRLSEAFGQSAVVDNRPGAGSTLGTDLVAKAAPDGYTLLVTHNAFAINQSLYPTLPYDTVRDFAQVAFVGITTFTVVTSPNLGPKTVKELIALAKAKPGSLNYASTGAGGGSHLAMEYFKLATGTDFVNIPYKGTAPALIDVASGRSHVMISGLPGTVPFIKSKRVVALATTSAKRSVFLPDLPTLKEAGVPDYEFDAWYGVHAPSKTPKAIIQKLNEVIVRGLAIPEIRENLAAQGIEGREATPEQFSRFVRAEVEKMAKIIKASGARPD